MGSKRAQKRAKREARRRTRRAQREAAPAAQGKPSPTRAADPLIGYLARHDLHVLCDGDGCVIAGSRDKLQEIIRRSGPAGARMDTIQARVGHSRHGDDLRRARSACRNAVCPVTASSDGGNAATNDCPRVRMTVPAFAAPHGLFAACGACPTGDALRACAVVGAEAESSLISTSRKGVSRSDAQQDTEGAATHASRVA